MAYRRSYGRRRFGRSRYRKSFRSRGRYRGRRSSGGMRRMRLRIGNRM